MTHKAQTSDIRRARASRTGPLGETRHPLGGGSRTWITQHGRAVAVEMHADLVPCAALRAAALVRERRQRRDVYGVRWHVAPFPVSTAPPPHRGTARPHRRRHAPRHRARARRGWTAPRLLCAGSDTLGCAKFGTRAIGSASLTAWRPRRPHARTARI